MTKKNENYDPAENNIDKFEIDPSNSDDNPVDKNTETDDDYIPDMADPKWSDYVLQQFEDDEVIEANILTEGLRRVVNKVLGPIIRSVPVSVTAPSFANNNHATVVWEVDILFGEGDVRTFGDCADVSPDNTNPTFAIHASATAATKAEGRALRKALQLKRVLTVEEVSDKESYTTEKINSGQISFINMMCSKHNIDVMKLINMGKERYKKIEDIPYTKCQLINKFLSECQRGKRKFPESIKGYNPNWRQS